MVVSRLEPPINSPLKFSIAINHIHVIAVSHSHSTVEVTSQELSAQGHVWTRFPIHHSCRLLSCFSTGILALMTFYLGVRMFTFEQEQMSVLISRQLLSRDHHLIYQFESTMEFNHKLISQLSDILSAVHNLVKETKRVCEPSYLSFRG